MRSQTINTWPLTGKTQVCVLGLICFGTNETEALPPTRHRFSLYCRFLLARPPFLPDLFVPHPPWLISPYCFNWTFWILFTEILKAASSDLQILIPKSSLFLPSSEWLPST